MRRRHSGANCLATLVRRDEENLRELIKLLDKAIALEWADELFTAEVAALGREESTGRTNHRGHPTDRASLPQTR